MAALTWPDPGDDVAVLQQQNSLMRRLVAKGEARRLGRTADIHILDLTYDGNRVWARVRGVTDVYHPWITLHPRPGHHCDCLDWKQNGPRIGPCKHVLRLAEEWQEVLIAKLEKIE